MRCEKCQQNVQENDIYEYRGQKLCEDCYIEAASRPKACDPAAVSAAKTSRELQKHKGEQGLTALQQKIYNYLKEKGKSTREEVAAFAGISIEELEKQFAILRHCQLARAFKDNGTIYLTTMTP